MDTTVVQQGRLGDGPLGGRGAAITTFEGTIANFLDRFKAVTFGALVFVERHERLLSQWFSRLNPRGCPCR